jgi:hypothetical protein
MPLAPPIDAIQQPAVGIYGLPVGASAGAMVLLTAAQIRAHADLSGYVPYTGATGAVTLGANGLTCGAITVSALTSGRIPFASTAGLLTDSSNLTWDGQTLYLNNSGRLRASSIYDNVNQRQMIFGGGFIQIDQTLYINSVPIFLNGGGTACISFASAGVAQIGTTVANALGSLLLTNLTASGTILTRNGTSPTSIQITNTYTSATSFGLLDIRANAAQTAYEISSFLGSAGGAALPINIGHRDSAGTFTSALSVATNGKVTISEGTIYGGSTSYSLLLQADVVLANGASGRAITLDAAEIRINGLSKKLGFATTGNVNSSNLDVMISRYASNTLGIGYGTGVGTHSSDGGHLRLTNLTALGTITASGVATVAVPSLSGPAVIAATSGSSSYAVSYRLRTHYGNTWDIQADSPSSANAYGLSFIKDGSTKLSLDQNGNITASGTILTRNGTSPTSIQITNTYTSSTSFGLLDIRANAAQTAYEISSFLGSAGGAALPINIGHRSSGGTFTSALSVATSGTITVASGFVSSNWTRIAGSDLPERGIAVRDSQLSLASNVGIYWSTALDPTNNQNGGTIKMLSGVLTISGQITHVPPTSSVTLGTNGQFSIEMTSDTAGNLVYRGSDGTTRRAALVFV